MSTKTETPGESLSQTGTAETAGVELSVRNLGHSFGALRALDGVELSIPPGTVLGIVGPSGCGKSTLLELIAGLREPDEGTIGVGGAVAPRDRLRRCAYMPQRDALLPWATAIDNAALALRIGGESRARARERAWPLFKRLGLSGFELVRPDELSGGMRQRVAFVRTLMAGKPVLLLDEPFASLDAITRAEMQSWLAGVLARDAHTVVMVSHDVEEALYLSDTVVALSPRPGRVLETLQVPDPRASGSGRGRDRAGLHRAEASGPARAGGRGMTRLRQVLAPALVIVLLLAAWQASARWDILADAFDIRDFLIPAPTDVAEALWEDRALLAENAWVTLQEVLLGFALAVVAGLGFAVLIHLSDTARRALYPLLVASQTVPIIVLAPIFVIWFGFGIGPKLLIVALICFFPITVNTLDGLRSIDPELLKMMRTLGAGRVQRLIRAEAPAALPYAFSGAKVAVAGRRDRCRLRGVGRGQ